MLRCLFGLDAADIKQRVFKLLARNHRTFQKRHSLHRTRQSSAGM